MDLPLIPANAEEMYANFRQAVEDGDWDYKWQIFDKVAVPR
jgi:hypothetical protein